MAKSVWQRKYEELEAKVISTTKNWPEGCESGKREFLEALDLDLTPTQYQITMTVTPDSDNWYYSDGDVEDVIRDNLEHYNEVYAHVVPGSITIKEIQ